jgi:hypothetical protein
MRPGMVLEVRPMLRTVSIMPGIDLRAPERQESSRGLWTSPNFLPIAFSVKARALATSVLSVRGYLPLFW